MAIVRSGVVSRVLGILSQKDLSIRDGVVRLLALWNMDPQDNDFIVAAIDVLRDEFYGTPGFIEAIYGSDTKFLHDPGLESTNRLGEE